MSEEKPFTNGKERFSNRVDAYRAGRPNYPDAVVGHLEAMGALGASRRRVVDVGAGTGLSAEPFLRAGYEVVGVEPNEAMRSGGLAALSAYSNYRTVDGSAENTTLPSRSCDLVLAAQAFHWFDPRAFREEARRILREGGFGAIVYNDRDASASAFARDYEALLVAFGRDYLSIRHRHEGDDSVPIFFGSRAPVPVRFPHERVMSWEAIAALAGSASYLPAPGEDAHAEMMTKLRALFDRDAEGGAIRLHYRVRLYAAPL